jgi:hypothetical protein
MDWMKASSIFDERFHRKAPFSQAMNSSSPTLSASLQSPRLSISGSPLQVTSSMFFTSGGNLSRLICEVLPVAKSFRTFVSYSTIEFCLREASVGKLSTDMTCVSRAVVDDSVGDLVRTLSSSARNRLFPVRGESASSRILSCWFFPPRLHHRSSPNLRVLVLVPPLPLSSFFYIKPLIIIRLNYYLTFPLTKIEGLAKQPSPQSVRLPYKSVRRLVCAYLQGPQFYP